MIGLKYIRTTFGDTTTANPEIIYFLENLIECL